MKLWYNNIDEKYLKKLMDMSKEEIIEQRKLQENVKKEAERRLNIIEDYIHHKCPKCNALCDEIGTLMNDVKLFQCPDCRYLITDNQNRCVPE